MYYADGCQIFVHLCKQIIINNKADKERERETDRKQIKTRVEDDYFGVPLSHCLHGVICREIEMRLAGQAETRS